jgi:hypothetical protein
VALNLLTQPSQPNKLSRRKQILSLVSFHVLFFDCDIVAFETVSLHTKSLIFLLNNDNIHHLQLFRRSGGCLPRSTAKLQKKKFMLQESCSLLSFCSRVICFDWVYGFDKKMLLLRAGLNHIHIQTFFSEDFELVFRFNYICESF